MAKPGQPSQIVREEAADQRPDAGRRDRQQRGTRIVDLVPRSVHRPGKTTATTASAMSAGSNQMLGGAKDPNPYPTPRNG